MGGELWHRQAQNGVNLDFQAKFDLEGQGQSQPKTIRTLTKWFCIFCANLVVLAGTVMSYGVDKLGVDGNTQTDSGNDNTRSQNWPLLKKTQLHPLEKGDHIFL